MPGFEVIGDEEKQALNELFERNGILYRYGFDALRKNVFKTDEFEKMFAETVGSKYAQAVTSGSAALLVALKGLGIGPGDEVITQSHTFVATVEAIIETGATPVITEIDDTLNMDIQDLKQKITDKTKCIIPVHMMGSAANMDEIMAIAKEKGIAVLEDACQAIGGTYKGKMLGSIGTLGAYSFDYGKTITSGEGGMVVTNDETIFKRAGAYSDHGHDHDPTVGRADDTRLHGAGFNYRMCDLQAAVGIAQLKKLEDILVKVRANKKKFKERLKDVPGITFRKHVDEQGEVGDSLIFYAKDEAAAKIFVKKIQEAGLGTKNLPDALKWHYAATWDHMLKGSGYENLGSKWPKSNDLLYRAIALPVMINMADELIERYAKAVEEGAKAAGE